MPKPWGIQIPLLPSEHTQRLWPIPLQKKSEIYSKTLFSPVGTLQLQAVNANTKGTGIPKRFFGMFVYLDLEKMAWRGFKEERFIGTIEN